MSRFRTLGQFGGHVGRALRVSDVLQLAPLEDDSSGAELPESERLHLAPLRMLRVMIGPQAAPDFFTAAYLERFFEAQWEVHFNSSRTGVRLIGPKPEWARTDGGEAGLHPSNLHDNAYAVGAVDFTGDMPVILGPDGSSLGGFVCPATVIEADRWQLGQLKAGDRLQFVAVDDARRPVTKGTGDASRPGAVLLDEGDGDARLVARRAGDRYLLLEFGPPEIDVATRFRIDALMNALLALKLPGMIDVTPGIRSLQLHYQPDRQTLAQLLDTVSAQWHAVALTQDLTLPSRIVHLPLSWDDPATRVAIDKYMTTVRKDAPWCPSNLEFIRRINGLASIDEVKRIVFEARYLVMGLGDVYLGEPVATPLDPRHRLVTTKYNPARTWTPENAVGIGGAYLCVYGMEGPGGYQFVGRTLQMWNRYRAVAAFCGQPYLLRFFDQIQFFEVSATALQDIRRDFPLGRYPLRIEPATLSLEGYRDFLAAQHSGIEAFRSQQRAAFADERAHWEASGLAHFEAASEAAQPGTDEPTLAAGEVGVYSPVAGNLWKFEAQPGDTVSAGQVLAVLEAMKMEIQVVAPTGGTLIRCAAEPGQSLRAGQLLLALAAATG